jgi:4-hydroxyphenylacetate 3-monooxygenase
MTIRDGKSYLAALGDDRSIYIDGKRVADVRSHPAFANATASFAKLYDFQAAPENRERMTFDIGGGKRANRAWQMPRSYDDLVQRRAALEAWSEVNFGMLGRSPDHVASTITGMAMGVDVFERFSAKSAKAVRDYYHYARESDLFISYVLQGPVVDRAKKANEQSDPYIAASVVDEDMSGITVRGAKTLGTSAVMSDEVFVGAIQPLTKDDANYAISFVIPLGTKGVQLLSRKSYEASVRNEFDYPLSTRYDESDAVVYFHDVKIPWERVFVDRDVVAARAQWHDTPTHVFQNYQSQVRLAVKMRFLVGISRRVAETLGTIDMPPVRSKLGYISAHATMVESLVSGMEASGRWHGEFYVPSREHLYAAQVLTQEMYPKVIALIRDLCGGGVIMLPSSVEDFANPELKTVIEATQGSPVRSAEQRVKLFRLAWDVIGSEFASRHLQYEMFYGGATHVTSGHAFRTYDWDRAVGMVDRLESSYGLHGSEDPGGAESALSRAS